MSALVSGLIGGAIAVALTTYVAKRVGRSGQPGQLMFGPFMWGLGVVCLAFALFPIALTIFAGHDRDFWAKVGLFVGFGVGGIYCLLEAALVRGSFDDHGIQFTTPWTGRKNEMWRDLVSLERNDWCSWYTFTFRSGAKIRLSSYLNGHLSALEAADAHTP
jgi:MFS family permease